MNPIWQFVLCGATGAITCLLFLLLRGKHRKLSQKDIDSATRAAMESLGARKLILEIEALERTKRACEL